MDQPTKKELTEKIEDKVLDVAGKVAQEGAKQMFGLGSAISWAVKIGSVVVLLVVVGVIALVVYLVTRFL